MISEEKALEIGLAHAKRLYGRSIEPMLVPHLSEHTCGWVYVFTTALGVSQHEQQNPGIPWYEDEASSSYPILINRCTGEMASEFNEIFPNRESYERYCCSLLPEDCLRESYSSLYERLNAPIKFDPAFLLLPSTLSVIPGVMETSPHIERLRVDNRIPFSVRLTNNPAVVQNVESIDLEIFDRGNATVDMSLFTIERVAQTATSDVVQIQFHLIGNFAEIFSRRLYIQREIRIKKYCLLHHALYDRFFLTISVAPEKVWLNFWETAS